MRILITANGSRGDVQPMLALALALREHGHEPTLAAGPLFASEAKAFHLPFVPVGQDLQQLMLDNREKFGGRLSLKAMQLMNQALASEIQLQFEGLIPLAKGFDRVVGGGFVIAAKTAAEAAGVPFHYVAYTPQVLPSAHHLPPMIPLPGAPRWVNRLSWWGVRRLYNLLFRSRLNTQRRALGLEPVKDAIQHFFPVEHAWVAADPELFPIPPDVPARQPGAFLLADERELPEEVERFLDAGAPPIYMGFGSMPDANPERTTRLLVEAARRAGCRVVLSSGWAALGATGLGPEVLTVGSLSHWRLFPRVAGVVHHGGAGTTAAAARAGRPQVVVPHVFDQFLLASQVARSTLGVSLPRGRLTVERLTEALGRILQDISLRESAARAGERMRRRDALKSFVQDLGSSR